MNDTKNGTAMLTEETRQKIDHWVAKFPEDRKRSALIQSLIAAQDQNGGWISAELTEAVADGLVGPDDAEVAYDLADKCAAMLWKLKTA